MATECTFTDRLPAEIRSMIYSHVLHREYSLRHRKTSTIRMDEEVPEPYGKLVSPSIFRVSRSIFEEAHALFFEVNDIVTRVYELQGLIRQHGRSLRQLSVTDCEYSVDGTPGYKFLQKDGVKVRQRTSKLERIVSENLEHLRKLKVVNVVIKHKLMKSTMREMVEHLPCAREGFKCTELGQFSLPMRHRGQEWRFTYQPLHRVWKAHCKNPYTIQDSDIPEFTEELDLGPYHTQFPWRGGSEACLAFVDTVAVRGMAFSLYQLPRIEAETLATGPRGALSQRMKQVLDEGYVDYNASVVERWPDHVGAVSRVAAGGVDAVDAKTLEWVTELFVEYVPDYRGYWQYGEQLAVAREMHGDEPCLSSKCPGWMGHA